MFKNFKVNNAKRVEFEDKFIQIPKSEWAYLRNNIDTFHTTGGEGTPSEPIPIVNVSEWKKTVCGKNLFNLGVKTDYSNTYYNFDVVDNGLQIVIPYDFGSSARFFRPEYLPIKNGYFTGKFTAESLSSLRCLIQLFDTDKNDITSTKTLTGWTYNTSYAAFYNSITAQGGYAYFNITDTDVKFIKIGFAFNNKSGITYPATARMFDIELNLGTPTSYQPYQGKTYPYRLEDVNNVLHEAGDLPDGTADSVNWETGEFVERVKKVSSADFTWQYQPIGSASCLMTTLDYDNIFDDLLYDYQIRCSNYKSSMGTYNWQPGYIWGKHEATYYIIYIGETFANIGILEEDDYATRTAKVRAYIATNPFTIQYKLATPVTYQIKQYDSTFPYNEKPIQVEDSVCNVFSDKNVKMKFKAVSY